MATTTRSRSPHDSDHRPGDSEHLDNQGAAPLNPNEEARLAELERQFQTPHSGVSTKKPNPVPTEAPDRRSDGSGSHDDLGVHPERKEAEVADLEKQFRQPSAPSQTEADEQDELNNQPDEDSFYSGDDDEDGPVVVKTQRQSEDERKKRRHKARQYRRRKRSFITIGLMFGGLIGGLIGWFIALVPMKIQHIIENFEIEIFSGIDLAIDNWTDKVFAQYLKHHIIAGLGEGSCTSTISRDCHFSHNYGNDSAISRAFKGMADKRAELKWAESGVLTVQRNGRTGNSWTLRSSKLGDIDLPDTIVQGPDGELAAHLRSRHETRLLVNEIKKADKHHNIIDRYFLGGYLERKYGIKRCRIACRERDSIADWRDATGNRGRGFIIDTLRRRVGPERQLGMMIVECLIIGGCEDPDSFNTDGGRRDKLQRDAQERLAGLIQEIGAEAIADLIAEADRILQRGAFGYIVELIATQIFNKEVGDQVGRAATRVVPILGWVDLFAEIVSKINDMPKYIKRWKYVVFAYVMIDTMLAFRSQLDERKSGNTDADYTGSFVKALSSNAGGLAAEGAPLFKDMFGTGKQSILGSLANTGPKAKVSAQGASVGEAAGRYICTDDIPIDEHDATELDGGRAFGEKLSCPEDSLNTSEGTADALEAANENGPPEWRAAVRAASLWDHDYCFADVCFNPNDVWDTVSGLPGAFVGVATEPITAPIGRILEPYIEDLVQWLLRELISSPLPDDLNKIQGAKNFGLIAGGMYASAFEFGQYGIGAKFATPEEVQEQVGENKKRKLEEFASLPLKERLFSQEEPYSLMMRVAVTMPDSIPDLVHKSIAYLSSPFSSMSHLVGSLFTKVGALQPESLYECPDPSPVSGCNPFSVPGSIFPIEEMDDDPRDLTDQECATRNREWQGNVDEESTDYRDVNEENGQDLYKRTNACKINCVVAGGIGGQYSDEAIRQQARGQCGVTQSGAGSEGIVGPSCPADVTLEEHPDHPGYFRMPDAPDGEYDIYGDDDDEEDRYGSEALVCTLYTVGLEFYHRTEGQLKLQIGDMNAAGHASHNIGIAVDVDGRGESAVAADNENDPALYSQDRTNMLGEIFLDSGIIENIWWCGIGAVDHGFTSDDGTMKHMQDYAATLPAYAGRPPTIMCLDGHYNHFHVDILEGTYALPFWEP